MVKFIFVMIALGFALCGPLLSAMILLGQMAYWLKTAQWPAVTFCTTEIWVHEQQLGRQHPFYQTEHFSCPINTGLLGLDRLLSDM